MSVQHIRLEPDADWVGVRLPFSAPSHMSLRVAGDMGPAHRVPHPRRDGFMRQLRIEPGRCAMARQSHTLEVRIVRAGVADIPHADGLLTSDPGCALAVTVADCLPILLYDRVRGAIGALHSGWRGTGIVGCAIDLCVRHFGSKPREIEVLLGPCIGACCYRVDEERANRFAHRFGRRSVVERDGYPRLDLRAANLDLLHSMGVEAITVIEDCVCCSARYGSFRREGAGSFTRMVAVIEGAVKSTPRVA